MPIGTLKAVVAWPIEQVKGWWENATKIAGDLTWEDAVPPAMLSTAAWVKEKLVLAMGGGTAQEQMAASFALGVAAYASSVVTLGATLVAGIFFTLTFGFGALRLWPVVDDLWPFGTTEGN